MDKSHFSFVGCLVVRSCLFWVSLYIRIMLTEFKKISGNSFSVGWHWASHSCSSMPSRWPTPRPDIILSSAALQPVACPSQNTLSIAENRFIITEPIRISLVCFITVCQSLSICHLCLCLYVSLSNWQSVCICLSICLPVCFYYCLAICLMGYLSVCLTGNLSVHMSVYLCVSLCVYYCLAVCITGNLSVCLYVSLFSLLFGSLSNWLSVCQCICLICMNVCLVSSCYICLCLFFCLLLLFAYLSVCLSVIYVC
jgi:hypothetical protein